MSDLANVKAGDLVAQDIPYNRRGVRLVQVERVTATQVVVGGTRYRKSDGHAVGYAGGKFDTPRVRVPSERDLADAAWTRAVDVMRAALWQNLPDDVALRCAEIVREHAPKDGAA